jgi:hypothetical protein
LFPEAIALEKSDFDLLCLMQLLLCTTQSLFRKEPLLPRLKLESIHCERVQAVNERVCHSGRYSGVIECDVDGNHPTSCHIEADDTTQLSHPDFLAPRRRAAAEPQECQEVSAVPAPAHRVPREEHWF